MKPLERALLETVDEEGPIHVNALSTVLDDHPITVDQICHDLHRAGYIRRLSGGVFVITEDGRNTLSNGTA